MISYRPIIAILRGITPKEVCSVAEILIDNGFNIIEVPVIFTDRSEGESKMSGGIFYEAVLGVINMKVRSIFKNWKK